MKRSVVLLIAAGTTVSVAQAQDIAWGNPAGGSWNTAGNWVGGNIPDSSGERAVISLAGPYIVTLDNTVGVGGLVLTGAGAELDILNGVTLAMRANVTNDRVILINSAAGGSGTILQVETFGIFSGTGSVVLNANPANLDTALFRSFGGGTLIQNEAGHTIRGTGHMTGSLTNNGLLNADIGGHTLQMDAATTNNGTLVATGGGVLGIGPIGISQGASGAVRADGAASAVSLGSASIANGIVEGINGGVIAVDAGNPAFTDVHTQGSVNVANGRFLLIRGGGITNDATILVNPTAGGSGTAVQVETAGTFGGAGDVLLNANPANLDTALFRSFGGGTLIFNSATHLVHGTGHVTGSFINEGEVNADVAEHVLQFDAVTTNRSLLTATGGSALQIGAVAISQEGSGQILATGMDSVVRLLGASINAGVVQATNGGLVVVDAGNAIYTAVTSQGPAMIQNSRVLSVRGAGMTNNGVITVNPQGGGSFTAVQYETDGALNGTGTIALNANPANLDTATLRSFGGGTQVRQGAQHTLRGTGRVTGTLINDGMVTADLAGAVFDIAAVVTNHSTISATGGGTMSISGGSMSQDMGARLRANAGTVSLNSANITGGLIEALGGGVTRVENTSVVTDVVMTGPVTIPNGRLLVVRGGALTNNGTITVNDSAGGSFSAVQFEINGALGGNGTIILNANPANLDTSTLRSFGGGTVITQAAAHTVRGAGRITGSFVNNGLVLADVPAAAFDVAAVVTNNAMMSSTGGATLSISGASMAQAAGARLRADGGTVSLNSANITGGLIDAVNSGLIRVDSSSVVSDVTMSGPAEIANGRALVVRGSGLTNNGVITVNPTAGGSATILQFEIAGTLGGTGSVVLNANPANFDTAILRAFGGGTSIANGPLHTVRGRGRIGAPFINAGGVAPGAPGGGTSHLDVNSSWTNQATAHLDFDIGGTVQGDTYDLISSAGAVTLDGTINVTLTNGYVPAPGQFFDVMTAPGFSEHFAHVNGSNLPPDHSFVRVEYRTNAVRVRLARCSADWNADTVVNSQDFFDYLNDFFANRADFNGNGVTDSQDFFDYLNAFFNGC